MKTEQDIEITEEEIINDSQIEQFDDYELFEQEIGDQFDKVDENTDSNNKKHTKRNEGKKLSFQIEEKNTLLDFLLSNIKHQSKTTVRSYLKNRQISINGIPTTQFDAKLKVNDIVDINLGIARNNFSHSMLDIVYEDDYLLVVNKKNGLLTMATDRERKRTAYFILGEYLKAQDSKNRIFIVHRLDRETSGLVLFAKSMEIQHQLQQDWHNVVLERKYVAIVSGSPEHEEGEVRSYLKENKAFIVYSSQDPEGGDLAITHYKILKQSRTKSLLELELETGRKNQIRVHMKDLGCPIIGDKKYGGEPSEINRVALHANKIRFIHPVTKQEMLFDTGIPNRFSKLFFFK